MTFDEILSQVRELLEREGRVAYRILKRRFALTDDDVEDIKADLIDAKCLATDEDGKVLVWAGAAPVRGNCTAGVLEFKSLNLFKCNCSQFPYFRPF